MGQFDVFARYYDCFYAEKDYSGEVTHLSSMIKKYHPAARSVLSLGCGTARYDFALAEQGFLITGVDASMQMIHQAERKREDYAGNVADVIFEHADIREYQPKQKYGAVISMFDVISYVVENDDLVKVFKMVSGCLEEDGVFIFDCWYGPGVFNEPPEIRVREIEVGEEKLVRTARPHQDVHKNKVRINYELTVLNGEDEGQYEELHTLRYFFLPELELMLSLAGMEMLDVAVLGSEGELSDEAWHATIISRPKARQID